MSDVSQKIKGKMQQAKGEYHDLKGEEIKAIVDKLKGKFNEEIADTKNTFQNHNKHI